MSVGSGPSDVPGILTPAGGNSGGFRDIFDLAMAMRPGMSEATTPAQIAKALAYWQSVVTTPTKEPQFAVYAAQAVTWLQAWQSQVASPPPNNLHVIYPV